MSVHLLKASLNAKFYEKHKAELHADMFLVEFRNIFKTIQYLYESGQVTDIAVDNLRVMHLSRYPALTSAAIKQLDTLLKNISEAELSNELLETLLKSEKVKALGTELYKEASEMVDGVHQDPHRLRVLVDKIDSILENAKSESSEVDDDIDFLLEAMNENNKWKFPLPNLSDRLGGIGPGVLGLIAGRPNSGKTAFAVSCLYHPSGFAAQGARVLYIGNEEPVRKTVPRGISCYTGMTWAEVKADKVKASALYAPIKGKIHAVDQVGLSFSGLVRLIRKYKPDIVVVDQLDKMVLPHHYENGADKFREIYLQAREVAKRHNVALIGVSQVSAGAEGKLHYSFDMLENSKTGKAAECDFIILIGKEDFSKSGGIDTGFRCANIVKNKLTGEEGSVNFMLEHKLSRIKQ